MMKKYLIIFFILTSNISIYGQRFPILDSVIFITKINSVYNEDVNWNTLEPKIHAAVNKLANDTIAAIKPAIALMLDSLNDNHSFLNYNGIKVFRGNKVDLYSRINQETKKAIGWPKATLIRISKFNDEIGYISIPGMTINPNDRESLVNELGQALRDSLCKLKLNNLKGIIVDLRLNTGGNMYPMIGGIAPLLGNGDAGSFVKAGKILSTWKIKNGNVYFRKYQATNINNNCIPNGKIKIAVLIGPATGSSGEATAISFIGKKNVRLFGEKSTGLVSANAQFELSPNIYYYLASSYEADRNKKEYKTYIQPDTVIFGGDNFENLLLDDIMAKNGW